jgi:type II secretion system protein N
MTPATFARGLWRHGAYPAFGLLAFVVALYATFPYDRLRDRLVQSLQGGRDLQVTIGAVEPGWGGGIVLRDVTVQPGGDDSAEPGTPLKIAKAKVSFALLAALRGALGADFEAELLRGKIRGEVQHDDEGTHVRLDADGLVMEDFPWIPSAIGLPLVGTLRAIVDLRVPQDRFAQADGVIDFDCRDCALGDGKAKFRLAGASGFLADGLTLPKLRIGGWKGRLVVEKGTARLEGFDTKSADGETGLEGDVGLRDPIAQSQMHVYFRFKLADELKRNDPKLDLLERGLSAGGRRTDGFYGLRISGSLSAMRFLPSRYSPTGSRDRTAGRSTPRRPGKPWATPGEEPEAEGGEGAAAARSGTSLAAPRPASSATPPAPVPPPSAPAPSPAPAAPPPSPAPTGPSEPAPAPPPAEAAPPAAAPTPPPPAAPAPDPGAQVPTPPPAEEPAPSPSP